MSIFIKRLLLAGGVCCVATGILSSCAQRVPLTMTQEEAALINGAPETMRILSIGSKQDSLLLRSGTRNFNLRDLNTSEYQLLVQKMTATLNASDGGVGLAAPQIGISRRVVLVKRFDKEGEPVEVYPNIRIVEHRGKMETGEEGCLSTGDIRTLVPRYRDITIQYTDVNSDRLDQPREIREDITGFTAVIFQHETDHLDGILHLDKAIEILP